MSRAVLVLEDGTTFSGRGYGASGETFGEMVFNTGMTGYQETLTDPSYCRQIVAMTAPHIGNTGVNYEDDESSRIWVAGYVVRDPARLACRLPPSAYCLLPSAFCLLPRCRQSPTERHGAVGTPAAPPPFRPHNPKPVLSLYREAHRRPRRNALPSSSKRASGSGSRPIHPSAASSSSPPSPRRRSGASSCCPPSSRSIPPAR